MEITKDYSGHQEKTSVIAGMENLGYRLKEDQLYFDGNHLIFSNEPEPEPTDWPSEWAKADASDRKFSVLARRLGLE